MRGVGWLSETVAGLRDCWIFAILLIMSKERDLNKNKVKFVNTYNLKWARGRSGFDLSQIYKKAGWKPESEKIEKWEDESDFPTISELRKLGEIYKRAWTLFIIEERVDNLDFKFLEFRKIFGKKGASLSPYLFKFLDELKNKQNFLIEFANTLNLGNNQLVGSCKEINDVETVAEQIILNTEIDIKTFRKKSTRREGFNYLAECLERKNIFILSTSLHQQQKIPLEQMRGVLLTSNIAPIIGINTQNESYGARIFTIFHELTHLFKGDSFDGDAKVTKIDFRNKKRDSNDSESFCNKVAARILVPDTALEEIRGEIDTDLVKKKCIELKVNNETLLYRMKDFGLLTSNEVNKMLRTLKEERIESRGSNNSKGGPDGGLLKLQQNGKAVVHAINKLYSQGEITFTQALNILDVKAKTYKKFAEKI